ncbi:MAG: hypothetical protein ACRDYU_01765 [Actinomycetes bacterium]
MTTTTAVAIAQTRVRSRPLFVGVALGIVYVVWGSTYLAIRIMVEETSTTTYRVTWLRRR